jgi:hypothetical protein
MATLTLSEADSLMIPKDHSGSGIRVVSSGLYLFLRPLSCLFFNSLWSQISLNGLCVD